MDRFVKLFQPTEFENWKDIIKITPHPEDNGIPHPSKPTKKNAQQENCDDNSK